jgi:hypothetical protein
MMFPHSVQVQPYRGPGAYGPVYGTAYKVRCLQAGGSKLVRNPVTGDEVMASAVLYCPAGTVMAEQSLVLIDGVNRTVMQVDANDPGGLPLPGSVVVYAR